MPMDRQRISPSDAVRRLRLRRGSELSAWELLQSERIAAPELPLSQVLRSAALRHAAHTASPVDDTSSDADAAIYDELEEHRIVTRWRTMRNATAVLPETDVSATAVYGPDSRLDIEFLSQRELKTFWRAALSTCLVCRWSDISPSPEAGYLRLDTSSLREYLEAFYGPPCDGIRFVTQPCCPGGTGVLVAPDVVVTAGHVLRAVGGDDVTALRFVFGFRMTHPDRARTDLPPGWVCSGVELLHQPDPLEYTRDWAVIRITRPTGQPAPIARMRRDGQPTVGQGLYVIGHPTGLPLKLASGVVRDTSDPLVISTTLDSFAGNSGSPVFSLTRAGGDPNDLEPQLEGILITGEPDDYVVVGGCAKPLVIDDHDGVGAGVQRLGAFIDKIP